MLAGVFTVGGYEVATGARTWYHLQRDEWSVHYNVSPDGSLFAGDGGHEGSVAKARDGKWIYLLSDRNLSSVVGSPWGTYQPEPFLDKKTKIYQMALRKGLRSPFKSADELFAPERKEPAKEPTKPKTKSSAAMPSSFRTLIRLAVWSSSDSE